MFMISIEEYESFTKDYEETFAINSYGYWLKKDKGDIYNKCWTFDKGTHLSFWWYPLSLMGDRGDVWEILNGGWFLNIITGETSSPIPFDASDYAEKMNNKEETIEVIPSKFKRVMGTDFPSTRGENWRRKVGIALEEYREKISERSYL